MKKRKKRGKKGDGATSPEFTGAFIMIGPKESKKRANKRLDAVMRDLGFKWERRK